MKNNIVLMIVVGIVVAAAAFFGGMKYQQSQVAAFRTGNSQFGQGFQGGANGQRRFGSRGNFGGATVGQIVSLDSDSITVKLQDGSSKIVDLSGTTTYSKTTTGAKSDLKVGQNVAAIGSTNSDGSITAQNIQLNPMFRTGPRPSGQPMPTQ